MLAPLRRPDLPEPFCTILGARHLLLTARGQAWPPPICEPLEGSILTCPRPQSSRVRSRQEDQLLSSAASRTAILPCLAVLIADGSTDCTSFVSFSCICIILWPQQLKICHLRSTQYDASLACDEIVSSSRNGPLLSHLHVPVSQGSVCTQGLHAENNPQGGPGPSWSSCGWPAAQNSWLWGRSFLLSPRLPSGKAWPSALLFPVVGEQTGSLVGAWHTLPGLLDIYLKHQLSFVHADRAWAQSPAPGGKHWLSHRWGLGQPAGLVIRL